MHHLTPEYIANRLAEVILRPAILRDGHPTRGHDPRHAAVLVPLCHVDEKWSVLFTKRSDTVGSHKGQVSFPGGMKDDDDVDDVACALRELEEEIGISGEHVQVLGESHPAKAITGVHVSPIVGYLGKVEPEKIWFNEAEISDVFALSFEELLHPEKRYTQQFKEAQLPVFDAGPFPVWGLTAYILDGVLRDLGFDV